MYDNYDIIYVVHGMAYVEINKLNIYFKREHF